MRPTILLLAVAALAGLSLGFVSVAWGSTPAGNTALVAPLLGGPAFLAAGWVTLALSLGPRVRAISVAAGAVAAAIATTALGAIAWVVPAVRVDAAPPATPVVTLLSGVFVPPLVSVPVGVALAAVLGHAPTRRAWIGGAIAASAAAAVPVLLYFTALKSDLVSRVFPLTELGPLVAFALAVLFLGEPLSPQRLLGTVLVIAGIFLIR